MQKLAVVALGGNAIQKDNESSDMQSQYQNTYTTCEHIVDMIEAGWKVVIAHGNGPQVGNILRQSELTKDQLPNITMDYAGAYTQGAIGYMFCNALRNILQSRKLSNSPIGDASNILIHGKSTTGEPIAIITQTLVDSEDQAFKNPTKPVGSWYTKSEAELYAEKNGWHIIDDSGRGWRRVVPSPEPIEIIEINVIKDLVNAGHIVIAVGGGGIPVIRKDGVLQGVEAVIDKDRSAALLASALNADLLILPTAVEHVSINFGKPNQKELTKLTINDAKKYLDDGHFHKGSMEPKIRALIDFVSSSNGVGIITTPENISKSLELKGCTYITDEE